MKNTELKSERLILRRFMSDDWRDLYEYLSNEEVVKFEPYEVFGEEDCKREAVNRSNQEVFWAVCLKDNNKLIGNVYFQQLEPKIFSNWTLGYVFNLKYSGHGYATEACKTVINYGIKSLKVRRVIAMCNPENNKSWKLLERLNFRREGHLIKNIYFKMDENGLPKWNDTYEYAILAEEWEKYFGL